MLLMSWKTFLDRWPVFLGSIITVCLGVALVQSSLLTLVSAATADPPPGLSAVDERAVRDGYTAAIALLGMTLGLAFFVAIFVVSSTFAFTVAQRRRDLALLRLTGAARGQVRTLLVGEALLLGATGSLLGIIVGRPLMRLQGTMLTRFELAPPGFTGEWRSWIIYVSAGTGVGVAVLGVLAASRRASRVRPLEALRDLGAAARVMTASRWVFGLFFLAGSIALLILTATVGGEAALPLSINATFTLVTAFAAFSPLVVPLVAAPFGWLFRGRLGVLAHANLRTGVRRSASTAAPIMVLVAFAAGMAGMTGTINEAGRAEIVKDLRADLVVETDRSVGDRVAAAPGVTAVSEEAPVSFDIGSNEGEDGIAYESTNGLGIDPAAYTQTHQMRATAGNLADLRGETIALNGSAATGWRIGDLVPVKMDGGPDKLRVVALLPDTVVGPSVLLPADLAPDGPRRYVVRADDPAAATAALAGLGQVLTKAQFIDGFNDDQQQTSNHIMIALIGMTMVYTVIAMVNAVVIAASDRRAEFATARVTGLTRGQVVVAALAESLAVVGVGVLLGGLSAVATIAGMASAFRDLVGVGVVSVPWAMFGGVVALAVVVVGVTSVLTSLTATRTPAIRLVAARE